MRLRGLRPAGPATRLDSTADPAPLAATLDHAWAPALAARGRRLALTWTDFRDYEWNAYARSSPDGGATWGAERAVNDTPDADEALEDTPRPALLAGGPLVAFTDWAKSAASATRASPLYDVAVARPGEPRRRADGSGGRHVEAFAPALVRAGGDAIVAWQDHRRGPADILAARVRGGRPGAPVRVDDSGRRGLQPVAPGAGGGPGPRGGRLGGRARRPGADLLRPCSGGADPLSRPATFPRLSPMADDDLPRSSGAPHAHSS